jgi:hypothetical protein
MHELGHLAGLADREPNDATYDRMAGVLAPGNRRLFLLDAPFAGGA